MALQKESSSNLLYNSSALHLTPASSISIPPPTPLEKVLTMLELMSACSDPNSQSRGRWSRRLYIALARKEKGPDIKSQLHQ